MDITMAMHHIKSLEKIIAWAKIAKKIYVPLNGSGGASVQVNRDIMYQAQQAGN